jgi:hypothetical protein
MARSKTEVHVYNKQSQRVLREHYRICEVFYSVQRKACKKVFFSANCVLTSINASPTYLILYFTEHYLLIFLLLFASCCVNMTNNDIYSTVYAGNFINYTTRLGPNGPSSGVSFIHYQLTDMRMSVRK